MPKNQWLQHKQEQKLNTVYRSQSVCKKAQSHLHQICLCSQVWPITSQKCDEHVEHILESSNVCSICIWLGSHVFDMLYNWLFVKPLTWMSISKHRHVTVMYATTNHSNYSLDHRGACVGVTSVTDCGDGHTRFLTRRCHGCHHHWQTQTYTSTDCRKYLTETNRCCSSSTAEELSTPLWSVTGTDTYSILIS